MIDSLGVRVRTRDGRSLKDAQKGVTVTILK